MANPKESGIHYLTLLAICDYIYEKNKLKKKTVQSTS